MTQAPLVVDEIKRQLARQIGRQWKPGERLPAVTELARQLGTGETNTHRALKSLAADGVLVSRRGRGTFVAPRKGALATSPDGISGAIAPGRRAIVCLPLGLDADGMVLRIANAFTAEMSRRGHQVERIATTNEEQTWRFPRHLVNVPYRAVALINADLTRHVVVGPDQCLAVISTAGIHPQLASRYDLTSVDHEQGGRVAGEHMRQVASGQLACYLTMTADMQIGRFALSRLRGFETTYGAAVPESQWLACADYAEFCGAEAVTAYLRMSPRPTALFAASDELARGFIFGAISHGLRPGRDYQIIGFDGQAADTLAGDCRLTSVAVPCEDMGQQAAEFLAMRLANPTLPPRAIALGCRLREGTTTRV